MKLLVLIFYLLLLSQYNLRKISNKVTINYSVGPSRLKPSRTWLLITDTKSKVDRFTIEVKSDTNSYYFIDNKFYTLNQTFKVTKNEVLTPRNEKLSDGQVNRIYYGFTNTETKKLLIYSLKCGGMYINLNDKLETLRTTSSTINNIFITGTPDSLQTVDELYSESTINSISYSNVCFNRAPNFNNSQILGLNLENCTIKHRLVYEGAVLPDNIKLEHIDFNNAQSIIDLTGFRTQKDRECKISFSDCDISKVKLNYTYFKLIFKTFSSGLSINNEEKEGVYKMLLDEQKKDGFEEGYKKLAIEYKEFKYRQNPTLLNKALKYVDKYWWDYGYNTGAIVKNSFTIFLFFFALNLCFYEQLLLKGYSVKSLIEANNRLKERYGNLFLKIPYKAFYCLIYTGYIFWGIKLDFEKLKLVNIIIPSYIIIQYLSGLVCITYILHYYFTA